MKQPMTGFGEHDPLWELVEELGVERFLQSLNLG
jgi:hypothetical protein